MKTLKTLVIIMVAVMITLYGAYDVMARGGGGHMGGGGWSGGHGGDFGGHGGGDRGGDFGGRGGDIGGRGGEYHGGGDHGGGDHGQHRHNNNNNNNDNNGNTTNNVNVQGYGGGGWGGWGYGAADGALAGLAIGTTLGAVAASNSGPSTIVVEQPSTTTVIQQAAPTFPVGTQVTSLPGGCQGQNENGVLLYNCGGTWYKPFFGPSGVYYQVVTDPTQSVSASQ